METILKIGEALVGMIWELYWGLALGFILSSIIRAFVSTETITKSIGGNSIKSLGISTFFGAISSSCSYAAASMSRTLMTKGASLSNAVAFLISSTNLVFEIFIVILSLLGWSFFMGELIGGLFFIGITAILIAKFFPKRIMDQARAHLKEPETMGGHDHSHPQHSEEMHAEHDHSSHMHPSEKGFGAKLKEASGHFVMDVQMVGKDILIGVIISAFLMVLVPKSFWEMLFLSGDSGMPQFIVLLWNAVVGALIAVVSFVCSVGNIVLAAVLWYGGISFGGVIAFILSDLITIPMLQVYKKYFGLKPMLYLFGFLFLGIISTALFLDYSFEFLNWIPENPTESLKIEKDLYTWNYKTVLNLIFIPTSLLYFFWGKRNMKM